MAFRNKFIGTLVFLLFLLPQIYQAIHTLSHSHDFHCEALTEKHYHEGEVECRLCDHVLPLPTAVLVDLQSTFFYFDTQWKVAFSSFDVFSRSNELPDLRGPPAYVPFC